MADKSLSEKQLMRLSAMIDSELDAEAERELLEELESNQLLKQEYDSLVQVNTRVSSWMSETYKSSDKEVDIFAAISDRLEDRRIEGSALDKASTVQKSVKRQTFVEGLREFFDFDISLPQFAAAACVMVLLVSVVDFKTTDNNYDTNTIAKLSEEPQQVAETESSLKQSTKQTVQFAKKEKALPLTLVGANTRGGATISNPISTTGVVSRRLIQPRLSMRLAFHSDNRPSLDYRAGGMDVDWVRSQGQVNFIPVSNSTQPVMWVASR